MKIQKSPIQSVMIVFIIEKERVMRTLRVGKDPWNVTTDLLT